MSIGYEGTYPNTRRVNYDGGAQFIPTCQTCGRFVTADATVQINEWTGCLSAEPNATCSKCGRTHMLFEGFFGD